jgi:hypothetical protein
MKKYFLLFCISALVFTGCNQDELDIPQKGVVPVEDYYKTDEDAEAALAAMYLDSHKNFAKSDNEWNFGPLFGLTNFQSPDIYLAGSGVGDCVTQREFQQFRYTNTNALPLAAYTMFYRSIHKANIVINNFEAGTSNTMKRAVAEARVMRAYDHMMLGIYWGTPPIVTEVLTGEARPKNAASQEAVMDWVANEIDLAIPDLTERQGKTDRAGAVRITKGFAYAIKGKALLWKGDYTGAKTALKEVISSGNYELVPSEDMVKIGHADGKASSESVFEFNMVCDPAVISNPNHKFRVGWNDHMTFNWRFENLNGGNLADSIINNNGWGWVNPTGDFARALIANDGMESARRKAWIKTYDEILYDHEWASDFTPIKDAEGNVIGKEPKNLTRAQKAVDPKRGVLANASIHANEGYFIWKNVPHVDQGDVIPEGWAGTWNKNFQIMRYAEVLLMYAEACAQTPDASDDADGLQYLQAIQDRAGVKPESRSTALTLADVQNEMRFELWLEGDRTVNLIRWGDTQQLKEVGSYMPDLRDALNYGKGSEHGVYIDASKATYYKDTYDIGFKPGKHELLPFPKLAVELNPGLKQNPNWD